jgi:glycine cleavage system H lipoate-binding protein
MDHISPVGATPREKGWICQVELSLMGGTLAALMKEASCASSAIARL